MRFFHPSSLINKLGSKRRYERLTHEDDEVRRSNKKPRGAMVLFVGQDEKKYAVPIKYFTHRKLQQLLDQYQGPVFDPRFDEPIVLECSTETFEQCAGSKMAWVNQIDGAGACWGYAKLECGRWYLEFFYP